jgi:hypothetical protein
MGGISGWANRAADNGVEVSKLRVLAPAGGAAGTPTATLTVAGTVKKAAAQATFAGADVTALKVELNAFYAKLQAAGIVA